MATKAKSKTAKTKSSGKKPAAKKGAKKAPGKKSTGGNSIKAGAVLAIYFDKNGNALQQESITPAIRSSRVLGKDVPIPTLDPDDPAGKCGPGKFPCPLPGGTMGCCG